MYVFIEIAVGRRGGFFPLKFSFAHMLIPSLIVHLMLLHRCTCGNILMPFEILPNRDEFLNEGCKSRQSQKLFEVCYI